MMKNKYTLSILVLLAANQSFEARAQGTTQSTTTFQGSMNVTTQNRTGAPAGQAGPAEIITGLARSAETFQDTVREVQKLLADSAASRETGTAALDRMLTALRGVEASVSDQGEIWQQYAVMIRSWQQNQRQSEERALQDPAFREQADAWGKRVAEAGDLRANIARERNRVRALIGDVERDREVLLGWYSLGQADRALQGLRRVSEDLTTLNDGLSDMVQRARRIGAGS
jgi:hypothetical protein